MKPETTADLIAALNNSAAAHTNSEKDDTKQTPPPDSIPCTLAGELDTDEDASQGDTTEEEADTMDHEDQADDSEQDQKDNEPSKSEAEKEQEKKEQEAKDAARWHDYARAFASNPALGSEHTATISATQADNLLAAFKSRFPNA